MKDKIIIILTVLLLSLLGYFIYDQMDGGMSEVQVKTELSNLKTEYKFIQKDLEYNLKSLDLNNKIISVQKRKIENILKKNNITEAELVEAKKLMREISQSVLEEYQKRVKTLEIQKKGLMKEGLDNENQLAELNSKINKLETAKKEINNKYVFEKKDNEKKTVLLSYASGLSLSNFTLKSVKVKKSGKEVETEKASRIEKIKVSFDINDNPIAREGKKDLYIVVKNPDGDLQTFTNTTSGTFISGGKYTPYSDKISVNFQRGDPKTVEFEWDGEDFKKGKYSIEVYENNSKKISKIGGAIKTLE